MGTFALFVEGQASDLSVGSDDEIADEMKACFADAACGGFVAGCMADPEILDGGFLLYDGLEEMRIDAATTPLREGEKIPEVVGVWGNGEGKVEFGDGSSMAGNPATGGRLSGQESDVGTMAVLKAMFHALRREAGKVCQHGYIF
jgi:hypothetical protein